MDASLSPPKVSIKIRGSKTDQKGMGAVRHRIAFCPSSENADLCPVKAVSRWTLQLPDDVNMERFAFDKIHGNEVAKVLYEAEARCRIRDGLPPLAQETQRKRYGTHSLRSGGACALWAAGVSITAIMREGRWASFEACEGYLWNLGVDAATTSEGMQNVNLKTTRDWDDDTGAFS